METDQAHGVLDAIELETGPRPCASVIWLHGLGADGNDFVPVVRELDLPASLPVRFVFPHAPMQPVTINNGYVMRAWYDISSRGIDSQEDERGIRNSQGEVEKLIAYEQGRGIAASRIVLAGFSQGGAIALQTGLRLPAALAGIIALSCYLPLAASLAAQASPANAGIPVFMAHGTHDPVVSLGLAQGSKDLLEKAGYRVDWHTYAMPHSVCMEEIGDIGNWLRRVLEPA